MDAKLHLQFVIPINIDWAEVARALRVTHSPLKFRVAAKRGVPYLPYRQRSLERAIVFGLGGRLMVFKLYPGVVRFLPGGPNQLGSQFYGLQTNP